MAGTALAPITYLSPPPSPEAALAVLPAACRAWFGQRFGEPTPGQRLAWPAVADGGHLLLAAPTGTGKTLAAFLPLLGAAVDSPFSSGVRYLYLAPLKALVNDARRNLRAHVTGLRHFLPDGAALPRVGLRTGDTPQRLRRRLRLRPPELLLTTPESLAVLLSQPSAIDLFRGLHAVVVDEVHALAGNKRGADLSLSLERLAELADREPQRIGLSATCTPLPEAARFLAGAHRPCRIAYVPDEASLELAVEPLDERGGFLPALLDRLRPELASERGTLVFTNTRGLAERVAWGLRRRFPEWDQEIAAHHAALAPPRRRLVERRFKHGHLRAVVCSTSLELGIDVGRVDHVVLVRPPGGAARLLQRVGRAGHGPGRVRRGLLLTTSAAELLEAAVTVSSGLIQQCEPLRVATAPLDVLCQQLLGMSALAPRTADEAFALVQRAYPYRELERADFDACLDYLSGHGDWLPARLAWDNDSFRVRDAATARLLRRNVGTILAEEMRRVLLARPGTEDEAMFTLGEVDDAFAERLQPGDRFLLDGRCLEYRRSEAGALVTTEVPGRPAVPQWRGDRLPLAPDLARRIYLLRVRAQEALRDGPAALVEVLGHEYGLFGAAARDVVDYLEGQEAVSEVPDATVCLVEAVARDGGVDYYVHTPLNQAGNDALARVAVRRLVVAQGRGATSLVADLGFCLLLRGGRPLGPDDFRELLAAAGFAAELEAALAESPLLRERFRRTALTGLMVLRNPEGRRARVGGRDWAERRLFEQVRDARPDFVLLRQAQREVSAEDCDLPAAAAYASELPRREVRLRRLAATSPFASAWAQVTAGPAESAETPTDALRRLHALLTGADSFGDGFSE